MRWRTAAGRSCPSGWTPRSPDKVAERIGEHARAHDLPSVDVILHGGEPLLAGTGWLTGLAGSLRARVPAQVNIGVQTNGTLLRPRMLQTLKELGISVGVSLDGDAEATGRHRLYPSGRNSFDDVADGLACSAHPVSVTSTAASCARSTCRTIRSPPTRPC